MIQYVEKLFLLLTIVTFLCQLGCKGEQKEVNSKLSCPQYAASSLRDY